MTQGEKIKKFRIDTGYDMPKFASIMKCSESLQRQIECNAKPASKKYISQFVDNFPNADIKYIFFSN